MLALQTSTMYHNFQKSSNLNLSIIFENLLLRYRKKNKENCIKMILSLTKSRGLPSILSKYHMEGRTDVMIEIVMQIKSIFLNNGRQVFLQLKVLSKQAHLEGKKCPSIYFQRKKWGPLTSQYTPFRPISHAIFDKNK